MGNSWFGKKRSNNGVVHPIVLRGVRDQGVTIKVRMTRSQLKDLIEKVDMSGGNGNSEQLGRLIVQECSKGRLHARVAAQDDSERANNYSRGGGLRTIQEHSEE